MKKIYALLFSTVLCTSLSAQQLIYFTPKKYFEVTIPYTVTKKIFYKTNPATKIETVDAARPSTTIVTISEPITVTGLMTMGDLKSLDLGLLGKSGRTFNMAIDFDSSGMGALGKVNGSQEPITGEVIKGVVGLASVAIKALTGTILGMDVGTAKSTENREELIEEKYVEKRIIDPEKDGNTVIITPAITSVGITRNDPTVTISLAKVGDVGTIAVPNPVAGTEHINIAMNIPQQYQLKVVVSKTQTNSTQTIIDQYVYVPQFGKLTSVSVPILRGKKTAELTFSPITGLLTKYGLTKTSTTSGIFGDSQTALEQAVRTQQAIRAQNQVDPEIAALTAENAKLDLLLKKLQVEKQIREAQSPPAPAAQ